MSNKKFRWSKVYESAEEELIEFLGARGLQSERIVHHEPEGDVLRSSETATTIWCAEGSLGVHTDNSRTSLQPGDAVRLDAGVSYQLRPGMSGYVCYITN